MGSRVLASIKKLRLSQEQFEQMLAEVSDKVPYEACGLLAGKISGDEIFTKMVIPVSNALASKIRFRMSPQDQLAAFIQIESNDLELIGIYHSHPSGPPFPSETDLAEHGYPDVPALIWSMQDGNWVLNAYELSLRNQPPQMPPGYEKLKILII